MIGHKLIKRKGLASQKQGIEEQAGNKFGTTDNPQKMTKKIGKKIKCKTSNKVFVTIRDYLD